MKFTFGQKVIIRNNLIGLILSGHIFDRKKNSENYRVAVDAHDCAYRISNRSTTQDDDHSQMNEDFRLTNFGVPVTTDCTVAPYTDSDNRLCWDEADDDLYVDGVQVNGGGGENQGRRG